MKKLPMALPNKVFFWRNLVPISNILQIGWNLAKGTLSYLDYDFNVYFFKILAMNFFGLNLVPKSNAPQINWNLVQGHIVIQYFDHGFDIYLVVHCYMLITILAFMFSVFSHSLDKLDSKILYFQNWFKFGKWSIVMCWLYLHIILNTRLLQSNAKFTASQICFDLHSKILLFEGKPPQNLIFTKKHVLGPKLQDWLKIIWYKTHLFYDFHCIL